MFWVFCFGGWVGVWMFVVGCCFWFEVEYVCFLRFLVCFSVWVLFGVGWVLVGVWVLWVWVVFGLGWGGGLCFWVSLGGWVVLEILGWVELV